MTNLTDLPKESNTSKSILVWLWAIFVLSAFSSTFFGTQFFAEQSKINQQISKKYSIPVESTEGIKCYKGHLHYSNQGNFSGLLSFSPSIKCDTKEFKTVSYNPFRHAYILSLFLSTISLMLVWLRASK